MKEIERFRDIRDKKIIFSLRTRLTLVIGLVVLSSILLSYGISACLQKLIPATSIVPQWIQLNLFSLTVATIATRYLSKMFFDPIKKVNEGMQKVADGDFSVRLETKSSSLEVQEMFAGFNMMAKELGSTEILQSDFVSNVSHEFKSPINAIEGYSTLLQGCDNLDNDQQEYIEKILFNTNRLSSLVSNILLLSKIENQSIGTKRQPYGLDEQIRESIVVLETAWEEKNIDFDVELDDVEYNGNEQMMRHVWNNLLGNAIKFSPNGSTITVRLKAQEDRILFSVADQGKGLSEEAKKHLFDKFYQADTSHKSEGNGLGLALVKRILAIDGSDVYAENIDGGGCRFTVILYTKH